MNLFSIAETVWRQIHPNPSDEVATHLEEVDEAAKTIYAATMWRLAKEERRGEGYFNVPSVLLSESKPLKVENGRIDISELKILRSLPDDMWLQNVGGVGCECRYVKSNLNHTQIFCDDDSLGDGARTYYVLKNSIVFPKGTHKKELPIIYANMGEGVDNQMEIDDAIGDIVMQRLEQKYIGRVAREDVQNDSSSVQKQQ